MEIRASNKTPAKNEIEPHQFSGEGGRAVEKRLDEQLHFLDHSCFSNQTQRPKTRPNTNTTKQTKAPKNTGPTHTTTSHQARVKDLLSTHFWLHIKSRALRSFNNNVNYRHSLLRKVAPKSELARPLFYHLLWSGVKWSPIVLAFAVVRGWWPAIVLSHLPPKPNVTVQNERFARFYHLPWSMWCRVGGLLLSYHLLWSGVGGQLLFYHICHQNQIS